MRTIRCLSVAAVLLAFGGCTHWQAPVRPPVGLLFTRYRAPLTADVTGVPAAGREGTASTLFVQDIILTGQGLAWDDASIATAAREGGLTKVYYADYEVLAVLGVFGEFTVRVYGE